MNKEKEWQHLKCCLEEGRYLSTPLNNKLLLKFLEVKINGGYGRIVYDKAINYTTCVKKARNIAKIDDYFKKDFDSLEEKDVLKLRDSLNKNEIKKKRTKIIWKDINGKKKSFFETEQTDIPLRYRTKCDYKKNFTEFWNFIIEYYFQKYQKELPMICQFWKVTKPEDYDDVIVEFLTPEEVHKLLSRIHNSKFKALVQLSIMSGARPCEAIKIKYGRSYNLYKTPEGKWIIKLPKIKGVSYKKFPFIIDMYQDDLYPYFDSLKIMEGDYVFKTSEQTFGKLLRYYSNIAIGRRCTPKMLRKTARMLRTNAGYGHDWINKLMGHAPGSKVQGHYTNYNGIENDQVANDKLQEKQNPSLKREYDMMKLELDALKKRNNRIEQILLALANEEKIRKIMESENSK